MMKTILQFLSVTTTRAKKSADVKVDLPDGDYKNEISGETVAVSNGKIHCNGNAIIIRK